jgi:hypothetical protein
MTSFHVDFDLRFPAFHPPSMCDGLITGEQVANSREVWATDQFPAESGCHSNDPNDLLAELEPDTVYALKVELRSVDVSANGEPE